MYIMFNALARRFSPSVLRPNMLPCVAISLPNAALPPFTHRRSLSDRPSTNHSRPAFLGGAAWSNVRMRVREASILQEDNMTPEERWTKQSERALQGGTIPADAYTGRTVFVRDGFAKAYRALFQRLMANNVRREFKSQERHEKKGIKRRRLRSERWRRLFANEVRRKVQLVNEIRRRGA